MEQRIQLRGHCPKCGREQAVINGGMAKHGYTVDFGYFHGTCDGAGEQPIEVLPRGALDWTHELRRIADRLADEALKYEQGELEPAGLLERYSDEWGRRKVRLIPYAELDERKKKAARANAISSAYANSRGCRDLADYLEKLVKEFGGQPLKQVKLGDDAKAIKVGDTVKVWGAEVVVAKIDYRTARGVGPSLNGQHIEHVFWNREDGTEGACPKRLARKVRPA